MIKRPNNIVDKIQFDSYNFYNGIKINVLEFDNNKKYVTSYKYYQYTDISINKSIYLYEPIENIQLYQHLIIYMKFINNLYFRYSNENHKESFIITEYINNIEKIYIDIYWSLAIKVKDLKQYFNMLKRQGDQYIALFERDYFIKIKDFKKLVNAQKLLYQLQGD